MDPAARPGFFPRVRVGFDPIIRSRFFDPIRPGERLVRLPFFDDPHTEDAPREWPGTFALFHQLWGEVSAGAPYDHACKARWSRLLEALQEQAWRAGYRCQTREAESTPGAG